MVDNNDNIFCNNGVRLANITFKIQTESGRKWVSIVIDIKLLPPVIYRYGEIVKPPTFRIPTSPIKAQTYPPPPLPNQTLSAYSWQARSPPFLQAPSPPRGAKPDETRTLSIAAVCAQYA